MFYIHIYIHNQTGFHIYIYIYTYIIGDISHCIRMIAPYVTSCCEVMKSRSGRVVATVTRLKGFTGGILVRQRVDVETLERFVSLNTLFSVALCFLLLFCFFAIIYLFWCWYIFLFNVFWVVPKFWPMIVWEQIYSFITGHNLVRTLWPSQLWDVV